MGKGRRSSQKIVQEEYIVEKIVGKREIEGQIQYLLKWQGYEDSENTWEPVENVTSKALIVEFEKSAKAKEDNKTPSRKSSRKSSVSEERKEENVAEENKETPVAIEKKKEKTTGKKNEEPSGKKNEEPSGKKNEKSSGKKNEEPPSKKKKTEIDADNEMKKADKGKKVGNDEPTGFARGLPPQEIVGATELNGKLMFLVKWQGSDEASLVPAVEANAECPQFVIKFYEERLTWKTETD